MPRNVQGSTEQREDQRKALLGAVDWVSTRHRDQRDAGGPTTLTEEEYVELLDYKQALRDWPKTGNPQEQFPPKPSWM